MNISKELLIECLEYKMKHNNNILNPLKENIDKEFKSEETKQEFIKLINKLEKENEKINNAIEKLIKLKEKQVSKQMEYRKRTGKHGDEKARAIKRFNNNKDLQVVTVNNMTFKREDLIKE